MQYSKNYKMNLPELADQFNLKHQNENTEKIDTQMKANADAISAETTRAKEKENSLSSSISTETSRAKTAESNIIDGKTPVNVLKDIGNTISSNDTWGVGFKGTGNGVSNADFLCCFDDKKTHNIMPISTEVIKQMLFDMMCPVNETVIPQYPGEPDPNKKYNKNGITSTWQDITATYNGRFFKIDTTKNVGDTTAESLPNISGVLPARWAWMGAKNEYGCCSLKNLTGNIEESAWSANAQGTIVNASRTLGNKSDSNPAKWTTIDNPAYKDPVNGVPVKVQPDNVSIKLWKRTK